VAMTAKSHDKQKSLTYKEFTQDLAAGTDPGPVVFFYGSERFLIDKAVHLFIDTHLDSASREYGLHRIDGAEVTWADLENALTSLQMFAAKKVIILNNPARLPASARTALTDYCNHPAENTWLGFVDPQPDWRKKPFKDWAESAIRVECNSLSEGELAEWIKSLTQARELQIGSEQISFLLANSDGDMQIISGILEKASFLVEKGSTISEDTLETATGSSRRYSWDTLLRGIANRDFQSVWMVVDFLQKEIPSPTYFTQILSRTFQGALIAQQFHGDIPFDINLYKSIGYFGQIRSIISMIARAYSRQEIIDALDQIRATDRELKNSSKSASPLIHAMLTKIIFCEKIQELVSIP
jgi:DNA polymerase-3 subunit delta